MKLTAALRFWGFLDLCYVAWQIYVGIRESRNPFFSEFIDAMNAAQGFGESYATVLTSVAGIMTLSILVSGLFLLLPNKIGAIISLAQFPFRVTLLITPTFFFIGSAPMSGWLLFSAILTLEAVKTVTLIKWLMREREYSR